MFYGLGNHEYSFAGTGMKVRAKIFVSRHEAELHMYDICYKNGLRIIDVYNDNHDKTYVCSNGVRFYIQRV